MIGCVKVVLLHNIKAVVRVEDAVAYFSEDASLFIIPVMELLARERGWWSVKVSG